MYQLFSEGFDVTSHYVKTPITFKKPTEIVDPEKDLVVVSEISSEHKITFKVRNLIILGKVITSDDVSIEVAQDFYNAGQMEGRNLNVTYGNLCHFCINTEILKKLTDLNICLEEIKTFHGEHTFKKMEFLKKGS